MGRLRYKMGGSSPTNDLDQARRNQVCLAVSDNHPASVPHESFQHRRKRICFHIAGI